MKNIGSYSTYNPRSKQNLRTITPNEPSSSNKRIGEGSRPPNTVSVIDSTINYLTCQNIEHRREKIVSVCIYEFCSQTQKTCCQKCVVELHQNHLSSVIDIEQFNVRIMQKGYEIISELSEFEKNGNAPNLISFLIEKSIRGTLLQITEQFKRFMEKQFQSLSGLVQEETKKIIESTNILQFSTQIQDLARSLTHIIQQDWESKSTDQIENLIKIYREESLNAFLSVSDLSFHDYFTILMEKIENFYEKTQQAYQEYFFPVENQDLPIVREENTPSTNQSIEYGPQKLQRNQAVQTEESHNNSVILPRIGSPQRVSRNSRPRPQRQLQRNLKELFLAHPYTHENETIQKSFSRTNYQQRPQSNLSEYPNELNKSANRDSRDSPRQKRMTSQEILERWQLDMTGMQKTQQQEKKPKFEEDENSDIDNPNYYRKLYPSPYQDIDIEENDSRQNSTLFGPTYVKLIDSSKEFSRSSKNNQLPETYTLQERLPTNNDKVYQLPQNQGAIVKAIAVDEKNQDIGEIQIEWVDISEIEFTSRLQNELIKQGSEVLGPFPISQFHQNSLGVYQRGPVKNQYNLFYKGQWSDESCQIREGYGIISFPQGTYYQGQWKLDKPHGFGRIIYTDGKCYEGEWVNGQCKGKGQSYSTTELWTYQGMWDNDLPNGLGRKIWKDGSVYEGEFVNSVKQGQGSFSLSNGSAYTGSFQNGKINGKGKFKWPDGKHYDGDWIDGQMNGVGIFKYPDGRIYEGQFQNDMRCGIGVYQIPLENQIYEGSWQDDLMDGFGKITNGKGEQKKGEWKEGKFLKWIE